MNSRLHDELISAYADGETTPEERAAVEKLLSESPDAREYLDHIRSLSGLLKGLPIESAPGELAGAVLQRAERATLLGPAEPPPAKRPSRRSILIVSALSVTATIALAVTITLKLYEPVSFNMSHETQLASRSRSEQNHELLKKVAAAKAEADSLAEAVAAYKESETQAAESGAAASIAAFGNRETEELKYFYRDLKNAKVGDMVDAWRKGTQDVVVVQLTVVDRREGLDSLQLVLTEAGVPKEPPAQDQGLKPNGNGYYAVYLESDPTAAEKVLSQLQFNKQVTDMHVAGLMATEDLNADFASNGYSAVPVPARTADELVALRNARNWNFDLDRRPGRNLTTAEPARKDVPAIVASKSPAPALKAGSSAAKDKNAPVKDVKKKEEVAQSQPAPKGIPARMSPPAGQPQSGPSIAFRNRQRQLVVPSTPADHNADGLADFARQMGGMGGMGGGLGRGTAQPVARPEPPPFPEPLEELAQTLDESKTTGKSIPAEQSQAAEPAAGAPLQTAQSQQLAAGVKVLFVVVPQSNPTPPAAPAEKADDCLEEKS